MKTGTPKTPHKSKTKQNKTSQEISIDASLLTSTLANKLYKKKEKSQLGDSRPDSGSTRWESQIPIGFVHDFKER